MKDSDKVIVLTKIKQWYIPADSECYLTLRKLGLPMTKFHENFLPTIRLVLKPRKIQARLKPFTENMLDPFLDKVGKTWLKRDYRDAHVTSKEIKLETTKRSAADKAKEDLPKVQECLQRFFERWGYAYTFEVTELRGRIQFIASFRHDGSREPIIPIEVLESEMPEATLVLGRVRLRLRMNSVNAQQTEQYKQSGEGSRTHFVSKGPEIELRVETKQGNDWGLLHLSHCLYSEVGNVMPMITALAKVINADPDNQTET